MEKLFESGVEATQVIGSTISMEGLAEVFTFLSQEPKPIIEQLKDIPFETAVAILILFALMVLAVDIAKIHSARSNSTAKTPED